MEEIKNVEIKNVEMTEEEADQVAGGGPIPPPTEAEIRQAQRYIAG